MDPVNAENLLRDVLSGRESATDVASLIATLDLHGEPDLMVVVLKGLSKFFNKGWYELAASREKTLSEDRQSYADWLKSQQRDFWNSVVELFGHTSTDVVEQCLLTGMRLMEAEVRYHSSLKNAHFPETSGRKLLQALLSNSVSLNFLSTSLRLVDMRYVLLKLFPKHLEFMLASTGKNGILLKAFSLLKAISDNMPSGTNSEEALTIAWDGVAAVFPDAKVTSDSNCCLVPVEPNSKALDMKEQQRAFENAWLELLRHDTDNQLAKSVLIILQTRIIPNLRSPCLLADFLTRCFSQGGGIALLSLHGIFVLMTEHNLEYPKFYTQLYNMIHPRIFDAKYQSRFFYLLNLFLSSSHLPAYLVAAFAKKLARLSLVAPTYSLQLLVSFILTLVERHPSIRVLVNRKNASHSRKSSLDNDPYLASQPDPAHCKAMESSLWELTTLRHHYLPSVAVFTKEIDQGPKREVLDLLEETYEDTFNSITEKDFDVAPLNHKRPEGLFGGFEDCVTELWSV